MDDPDFLPLDDDDDDPPPPLSHSDATSDDLILNFDSPSPSEHGSSDLSLIESESESEEEDDWILHLTDDESDPGAADDELLFTPPDSPTLSGRGCGRLGWGEMNLNSHGVGEWFGELSLMDQGTPGWEKERDEEIFLRGKEQLVEGELEEDDFEPIPISPLPTSISFLLLATPPPPPNSSKKRSTSLTSSYSSSSHILNKPPKKSRSLTPSSFDLLPTPTPTPTPTSTPPMKLPTQEEMDAFFGFVDPLKKSFNEVTSGDGDGDGRGCGDDALRKDEMSGVTIPKEGASDLNEEVEVEMEMGGVEKERKGKEIVVQDGEEVSGKKNEVEKEEKEEEEEQVYQLRPIPKFNLISGKELLPEERRLAIISSLEKLTLSVLSQLIKSVSLPSNSNSNPSFSLPTQVQPSSILPTPPDSQPPSQAPPQSNEEGAGEGEGKTEPENGKKTQTRTSKSKSKPKPKPKPIVIILAKRGGGSRMKPTFATDATQDQDQDPIPTETQVVLPTQRILFPRNGKGSSRLPAVLKTIELILEGLNNRTISTKRDLFYKSVGVFKKQSKVDSIIEDIAATLNVRREELNVVAASKGLFGGFVKVHCHDGVVLEGGNQGALIPPGQSIARVEYDQVEWVLIIEKEAVFHTLCHTRFLKDVEGLGNGILLTGKGYPDIATREFVKRLSVDLPCTPLLCLVDSDPHGLEILSTYKFGSLSLSFDRENLAVEEVEWIGVKGSEWDGLGVDRSELLELDEGDRKKALKILGRRDLPEEWRRELQFMLHLQRKAEIQVLSSVALKVAPKDDDDDDRGSQEVKQNLPLLFKYLLDKISTIVSAGSGTGDESDVGGEV